MKLNIEHISPVRNPGMKTSKGSYHGLVFSQKLNRHISTESSLEALTVHLFDMDPDISWFCEQPDTFEIDHQGTTIKYTPDFVIKRKGKFYFVEVKPARKAAKAKEQSRLSSIGRHFKDMGYGFVVLTEQQIRTQPRLNNIKSIARLAGHRCNKGHMIRVRGLANGAPSVTVGNLNALLASNDNMPNAYSIIRDGYGTLDMSTPVNDNSVVTFRDEYK